MVRLYGRERPASAAFWGLPLLVPPEPAVSVRFPGSPSMKKDEGNLGVGIPSGERPRDWPELCTCPGASCPCLLWCKLARVAGKWGKGVYLHVVLVLQAVGMCIARQGWRTQGGREWGSPRGQLLDAESLKELSVSWQRGTYQPPTVPCSGCRPAV